jgi:hypothetical protein
VPTHHDASKGSLRQKLFYNTLLINFKRASPSRRGKSMAKKKKFYGKTYININFEKVYFAFVNVEKVFFKCEIVSG